jgi:hypothetical protein
MNTLNNGGQKKAQDFLTDVIAELQLLVIVKKDYIL